MGKPLYHAPSSNTEALITIAAGNTNTAHEIEFISWSFDADPAAAAALTVESPSGTVLQKWLVTKGGPGFIPFSGSSIRGAVGSAMLVRLATGGSGVSGTVNAIQRLS